MDDERKTKRLQLDIRKLLAIGIASLALLVMVVAIILFSPQKTEPIDHFFKALQKGSVTELQKCMPPDALEFMTRTYAADKTHGGTFEGYLDSFLQIMSQGLETAYGDKVTISYLVTDKKEYDNQQLRVLAQRMEQKFGLEADGITEACEFVVDTTLKGEKDRHTNKGDLYIVYKYHEEWYLYIDPLSALN